MLHRSMLTSRILVLALVGATVGCADPATDDATDATSPGPHADTLPTCVPDGQIEPPHMDIAGAIYEVPVPADLEPYASYPIGDVSLCRQGTSLQLGYSLPKLLVGKNTRVSFTGTYASAEGTYELSSEDGTASCEPSDTTWTCFETFTGLDVDLERVADEAAELPAVEAAGRVDVAEHFGGDPIGILHFDLRN